MYSILIVDDEEWSRKGIISMLQYLGFRFQWVGEADTGSSALEIIREQRPDIVVTDVRMPIMSGVELMREVQKEQIPVKFVVISGYAEFEYAEQSLNLGAVGYILKPISDIQLEHTIKSILNTLDKAHLQYAKQVRAERLEQNRNQLLLEQTLNIVLNTNESVQHLLSKEQRTLPLFCDGLHYQLVMLHINNSTYHKSGFKEDDLILLKFAVINILEELTDANSIAIANSVKDLSKIFIVYFNNDPCVLKNECKTFTQNVFEKINTYLNASVTIAVSGISSELSSNLYKQAKAALDMRIFSDENTIYMYDNVKEKESFSLPELQLELLQSCLSHGDFSGVKRILNEIFLTSNPAEASIGYFRYLFSEIIRMIIKTRSKNDFQFRHLIGRELLSGEVLEFFDSPEQIVSYIDTTIIDLFDCGQNRGSDAKDIVNNITDFINQNFSEEITLTALAKKFAMNPNYLSAVFHQCTGKPLTKYIAAVRVERACVLLEKSSIGIKDISRMVGYEDIQYFYRVFKKMRDMTPMEFRNNALS